MRVIKKLSFIPLFLISLGILLYQVNPLLNSYQSLLSFSTDLAVQFGSVAILLMMTSLFFVIFGTLAQDWRIVTVVALLAAILPAIIIPGNTGLVLAVITFLSLILTYSMLDQKLKTYLSFQPTSLLSPGVRNLYTFLLIGLSFIFYLSVNTQIKKEGFQLPDQLIDSVINLSSPAGSTSDFIKGDKYVAQLTPSQIELLKQYPELLKQYNIDPKSLDAIKSGGSKSSSIPTTSLIPKQLIKDQISNFIKPYENFIAPVLAMLFFSTIAGFLWLLSYFLSPIIWLIFWAFEKSGFVEFTKETREVKKMVA